MTIPRVNPGGWSVGDKVTSAQLNQLDIDHAKALDKTSAGDTLAGIVQVASGGQILVQTGGGVFSNAVGGIETGLPRSLISGAQGAISLEGGPNDYPQFGPTPRSRSLAIAPQVSALESGWAFGGALTNQFLIGPATTQLQRIYMPVVHNGATLSTVTLCMAVGASHSIAPSSMPIVQVEITNITTGAQSLAPGASVPTPASGAAWFASGNLQTFTLGGFGIVIDNTQNVYTLILRDENGSGSVAGNAYWGFVLNYTLIADMKFST